MAQLISCLFFISVAFNSYRIAKRQGTWSWLQLSIVIVALIAIPILVVRLALSVAWLQDKPAVATLLITGSICVLLGIILYLFTKKIVPKLKEKTL